MERGMKLAKFEKKNMTAFKELAQLQEMKKSLDDKEKEVKAALLEGMKKYGIASIDNDLVRINYIPETESVSLDTKKWRADNPDQYHEIEQAYNKRTIKKEYIRVTVK